MQPSLSTLLRTERVKVLFLRPSHAMPAAQRAWEVWTLQRSWMRSENEEGQSKRPQRGIACLVTLRPWNSWHIRSTSCLFGASPHSIRRTLAGSQGSRVRVRVPVRVPVRLRDLSVGVAFSSSGFAPFCIPYQRIGKSRFCASGL